LFPYKRKFAIISGGFYDRPRPYIPTYFMSVVKVKDVSGELSRQPLAELILSAAQFRLEGALRLTDAPNKAVIYFKSGRVVYAVSNQKKHRLFQMIISAGILTPQTLGRIPNFTNDLDLAKGLLQVNALDEATLVGMMNLQLRQTVTDAMEWTRGTWLFDALARVKEEVHQRVDIPLLLITRARQMKNVEIGKRFTSFNDRFRPNPNAPSHLSLQPDESFLLGLYEGQEKSVSGLAEAAGMKDHHLIKTVYCLWMGGFLLKDERRCAIGKDDAEKLLTSAANARKKESAVAAQALQISVEHLSLGINADQQRRAREVSLEVFLKQVERAADHYEALNIKPNADGDTIKKAYFTLAKKFHPDRFHKQLDDATMRRVQAAFSNIAHAYDTLRRDDTRRSYDFKIGKNQPDQEPSKSEQAKSKLKTEATTEAQRSFDEGFKMLIARKNSQAVVAFAKAVDLSPNVGSFHAYYAKALAGDASQKFKAETHFQTAIRLEPENPSFRMMFAEFLVSQNLDKRAESELEKLLSVTPDHTDARTLLDSLRS